MSDFGRRSRRRHRRGRVRPRLILVLTALGLGLASLSLFARSEPLLIYNASASAPVGLYFVRPARTIMRGDLLLVRTPESVRQLAAERGYLPASVPLVKRVAALSGDQVCTIDRTVFIDGEAVARQLVTDRQGRSLPLWTDCRRLGDGEVFLLMADVSDSFDSRYFGPVPSSTVVGRLVPLWFR